MKSKFLLIVGFIVLTLLILAGFFLFFSDKKPAKIQSEPIQTAPTGETGSAQGSKYSFEELTTVKIEAAPLWLFAVADDQSKVVLSTEENQSIKMGFWDPDNPSAKVDWQTIVGPSDLGGAKIADHWHEFSNGYHWLAFSISEANTGYVMKVDRDLKRVALVKAVEKEALTQNDLPANAPQNSMDLPTNDMFLVPTDQGVSVGFFLPAKGHRVFNFDKNLKFISKTDIGGGDYTHGNGSSAITTADGFDLLAAETINYLQEGGLKLIKFNKDWQAKSVKTLFDQKGINVGMVSGLYLDDGSLVVNARVNDQAYSQEEMLQKAPPGSKADDGANIKRFHFDSNGDLINTTNIYEGTAGHRPHTAKIGDKLLTTWDAGAYLRIDKIKSP